MGLRHDIVSGKKIVLITGEGDLRMPEMLDAVEKLACDPEFSSDYAVILDLRHADYTAEIDDGDAFVAMIKRRKNDFRNRFALLVPEHLHFLARLYSLMAGIAGFDRMKCFTDRDEALRWCRE